jgi:outer membrane lipoprotein-sorting protein
MIKRLACLILCVAAIVPSFALDPRGILEKVDEHRAVSMSFKFRLRIEDFGKEGLIQSATMTGYAQGTGKTMVRYDEPSNMRGKKLLMVGDDLFVFIPKTQRPVRLTASQRLMGQASNGDVMNVRFQSDYKPALSGEESIEADGRNRDCVVMDLSAKRQGSPYSRIVLWVEKGTYAPLKAECYALSGKKLKSVEYSLTKEFEGKKIVSRATIRDLVLKDSYTILEFLDMSSETIPSTYFNKEYLLRM